MRYLNCDDTFPGMCPGPNSSNYIQGGANQIYGCKCMRHSLFLHYYLLLNYFPREQL